MKEAIAQTVSTFGRLDVVVNNAGYSLVGNMEELTDAELRRTLDLNLFGTVNVIRAAMPYLHAQKTEHIINIASNARIDKQVCDMTLSCNASLSETERGQDF